MRVLHLADLHIGKQVAGFSMIADQRFALSRVIETVQETGVEAVVLAGDIYDKTSPSEESVRLLDWFLSELSRLQVPCIGIPGNHDSADRLAFAQSLLARQGVHLPPSFDGDVSRVELSDEHGPVVFWMLPFLRPCDVKRAFPDAEAGDDATKIASNYTNALRAVLDACSVNPAQRNVIVSHQFVTSGGAGPDRASEELNLGGLDNVDVSVYDAFDYVALGHVHRPQRIGRDTARYAGSLLKYSFGEARFGKSAVLVELGAKPAESAPGACVQFELIPIVPLHDMREIRGPLEELMSPEVAAQGDALDYIHATLTDETPQIDALARLRTVYPNVMQLDYDTMGANREVVPDGEVNSERIDLRSLFADFFRQQAGHELADDQEKCVERALLAAGLGDAASADASDASGATGATGAGDAAGAVDVFGDGAAAEEGGAR